MTRATLFPPASHRVQWFAGSYPGLVFDSIEKLVIHTTETPGWPGYRGGSVAPNFTAMPDFQARRLLWRQHFPASMASRALVNKPGGVQTNLDRAVQAELIGTCRKGGPGLYWPEAPEWALEAVAGLVAWLHAEWGLVLAAAPRWKAYEAIAAGDDSARMSGAAWDAFRGVCGHQHVPENDHGDPGALDANQIIKFAGGEMALTDADIDKLAGSDKFRSAVSTAVWRAGYGGDRQGGKTEYADWRLWSASHPEFAAEATAAAVAALTEGPLLDALADKVVARLTGAGPAPRVAGLDDLKRAVREVLTEGTGGTP